MNKQYFEIQQAERNPVVTTERGTATLNLEKEYNEILIREKYVEGRNLSDSFLKNNIIQHPLD